MRRILCASTLSLLLASAVAFAQPASVPPMICPGAADATSCSLYHFHVQIWRPDTKAFAQELTGVDQFATPSACEAARTDALRRNQTIVEFIRRVENNTTYQMNRYGVCHCDMTVVAGNPAFLDAAQRNAQLRLQEEIGGKIREKLLDKGATPDSEILRGAGAPPRTATAIWQKVQPTPDDSVSAPPAPPAESEIKDTPVASENVRSTTSSDDLALVDVPTPAAEPVTRIVQQTPPVTPSPSSSTPPPTGTIDIHYTKPTTTTAPTTVAVEEPVAGEDDDSLDRLIAYETARVQAVLRAALGVSDDALKRRIFEAANERLQLLSNLRALVEGGGAKSKLAAAVRAVNGEPARQQLATRLFGKEVGDHWAPKDARDIIVDASADITDDPTGVLRDSTGRFTDEQKKLALYFLLARSNSMSPTQELWLSSIVEASL